MSSPAPDEPTSAGAFTILGVTRNGRKFRPSDWACRLAGPYGKVEGNVIRYHPDVQPVHCDGQAGVRVRTSDPKISHHLVAFAEAHDLVIVRDTTPCAV